MPPKTKQNKSNPKIDSMVEVLKAYLQLHHEEAVEALQKKIPEPEVKPEPKAPLTESPALNSALTMAYSWGRTGFTLFGQGVAYAQKNIIHNEALKKKRQDLVAKCLDDLEDITHDSEKLEKFEELLISNMALSLEHLGADYIHSGKLHRCLCDALNLTDMEADKLCADKLSEDNTSILTNKATA